MIVEFDEAVVQTAVRVLKVGNRREKKKGGRRQTNVEIFSLNIIHQEKSESDYCR